MVITIALEKRLSGSEVFRYVRNCVCACVHSAYPPVHGHVTTTPTIVKSHSDPYRDKSHDLHATKETTNSSASAANYDQVMMWVGLSLS